MKGRFKGRRNLNQEMVLQITSLADVFTIILVFLLKSFSTGATTFSPNSDLMLPQAHNPETIVETIKLEISNNLLFFNDKAIINLNEFQFAKGDLDPNETVPALTSALQNIRQKDTLQRFPKLLILADQRTPFSTLRRVLASTSGAGYLDYKLVVVEEE